MKVIKSFFHTKRQQRVAYLLMIITAIIWGGTWPIGRWLVSEEVGGATIPPFMIAFIRYILAVISFFIILKVKEGGLNWKYAKRNWKLLSIMGVLSVTIYQAGYLIGEIFTAASDASIMVATNAIWVVVLSSIFLKSEHFTWRKLFGTLLAFIAIVIVVGFSPNINLVNRILGDLLILLAALAYASYSVISRFFMVKTQQNSESFQPSSIWIISWVSFYGLLTTTPIALIISPDYLNPVQYIFIPVRVWVGIAYLAFISSIIAYTFYLEGIKRLDASRAAIFQTLVPIFGVLFSAIFLQEDFDIIIYPFALLLVISGITLVNLKTSLNNANKGSNVFELIDFEKINENEALIRLKSDFNFFIAAMLKMKNIDNFNHKPPSSLKSLIEFFYSNHDFVSQNEKKPKRIFKEFIRWIDTRNNTIQL